MSGGTVRPGPDHSDAFEELAVGWALHALEPEDAERLAAHLDACGLCRRVVEETSEVMAAMATAAPDAEAPPALRERLQEAVARTPQDPLPESAAPPVAARQTQVAGASAGPRPALPVPRRRWASVLVAAGVAAVVGLGGWIVVLLGDRGDAQVAVADEAAVLEELLRPGQATIVPVADDEGRTVATLLAREEEVQLVSQGLAPNDLDAETYVLWGVEEGGPEPLRAFDVTDEGPQLTTVAVTGADDFTGYAISVEPGRSAPEVPTDVVASGELPS